MANYIQVGNLQVDKGLYDFLNEQVLPDTEVNKEQFWAGFDTLIHDLAPENKALLEKRRQLEEAIHNWHKENKGNFNFDSYKNFLEEIEYIEPKVEDFKITTENVDEEISYQAGPQLVVPVNNASLCVKRCQCSLGKSLRCVIWNRCN